MFDEELFVAIRELDPKLEFSEYDSGTLRSPVV